MVLLARSLSGNKLEASAFQAVHKPLSHQAWCVCVRERERECVCVCVCVQLYICDCRMPVRWFTLWVSVFRLSKRCIWVWMFPFVLSLYIQLLNLQPLCYLQSLYEQTHGAGTQYVRRTVRCSTYNTKYNLTTRIKKRLQAWSGRHVIRETSLTSNRNPLEN
jgi:predicted membrane metal-binding protein